MVEPGLCYSGPRFQGQGLGRLLTGWAEAFYRRLGFIENKTDSDGKS